VTKTSENDKKPSSPLNTNPDRRNLPSGACLRREEQQPPVWGCAPGLGPPGKAMVEKTVAKDPAPGVEGQTPQGGLLPGYMGKAAPGLQGREAPLRVRDGTLPIEGKGVKYFCDVHRKAKNGEGYRITFTTDGVTFKHVDSLEDIPAKAGDKIYTDTIPLNHTDGAIELLRRGVEFYYLRRLTLIKERREKLGLPKTTRGDIKTLISLEGRWFRKLAEDFLIMRRMISAYRSLQRTRQQLENKCKALSEAEKYTLKPAIKALENQMNEMAKQIAEEAGRRYPAYNNLVEELGIDGNLQAVEALAEILVYPEWRSWRRTRNYFGLFPRNRKTNYHKSKTVRQALERLTLAVKGYGVKGRDLEEVLKTVWLTLKTQKTGPPA
jgi:hypothetical protein